MTQTAPQQPTETRSALLLEQLLQIAKISALEEMASGIAHELNQPIGAMATFAQAAERMLDRPEPMLQSAIEVLRHISQEALNAGQGIRRIRSLFDSHREGRVESELAEVIEELTPVLDLLARRRGATLMCSIQNDLPLVAVDRLRIQHVLFALVQNALEAPTREGQAPEVHIKVSCDRYTVQIAVEDHGLGVDEATRERLFQPFFTTKARGTGLGLASSRAIVEAHEGSIDFENIPDGGIRFVLRLPAAPQRDRKTA